MLKFLIGFAVLGVVFAYEQPAAVVDHPETFHEIPCLVSGGICVVAKECPKGRLSRVSGLCPVQQKQGVECCHAISTLERRCIRNGGECMPRSTRCPENLTYKDASDCEADEKCCILVK